MASPSKTGGRLSVLKTQLKEFCSSTTAHGLGHAASSKSVVGMVFWTVIFLAAFVFVMWQTYTLFVQFQSHPTNTKIKIEFQRSLDFPVVLICNHNMVKYSYINNVFHGDTDFNWTATNDTDKDSYEDIMYSAEAIELHMRSINRTTSRESGHSLDETVPECTWNDKKDCVTGDMRKYWKWSWHWRYGNCYSFNTGTTDVGEKLKILSVDYPGPNKGLQLDLNVHQEEYISSITPEAGIRVFIGNQGELASPDDEGFSLAPGAYYYVPMKKSVMERADPFHNGSCRSESDDITAIFEGVDTYTVHLASFMGDFGGLIGLWTGISCITAVELFAFVGCCLFSLIVRKRSTPDRRNGDDKAPTAG